MHGEIAVQIDIPGIPLMLGSCDMEHKFHLLSGGDTDTESSPSTEPEIQMLYASTDNILPFASSSIEI